jgi:hypothetical protein
LYRSTFLPMAKFYNLAFILGYLCLLRISNLTSKSRGTFDPLRDLRRGDLVITDNVLYINLRWTKTLQNIIKLLKFLFFPLKIQLPLLLQPLMTFRGLSRCSLRIQYYRTGSQAHFILLHRLP